MRREETGRGAPERRERANSRGGVRVPVRWMLVFYDALVYLFVSLFFLVIYPSSIDELTGLRILAVMLTGFACVTVCRLILGVYQQIWRYGGMQAYIRLILADAIGGTVFILLRYIPAIPRITFARAAALVSINLLGALTIRIIYQYLYQSSYTSAIMRGLR